MTGLVVVSHSLALAQAAVALAEQMIDPDRRAPLAIAAGIDDGAGFGTDAAAIAAAVEEVDSPDGVVVLMDLGSAVLSSEMALEFVDPDVAERTRLAPAPFVEGLVAAYVAASAGASADVVAAEATQSLEAKRAHVGEPEGAADPGSTADADAPAAEVAESRARVPNPHGLHARPAGALVAEASRHAATVQLSNPARGTGPAPATSPTQLAGLDARCGDELVVRATGPQAEQTARALAEFIAAGCGEDMASADQRIDADAWTQPVTAPAAPLPVLDAPVPDGGTLADYDAARADVEQFLSDVAVLADAPADLADIVRAQLSMLRDRSMDRHVRHRVSTGEPAGSAVAEVWAQQAQTLAELSDPYLRERAQDVRSLRRLLLAAMAGQPLEPPFPSSDHILTGAELDVITAALAPAPATRGIALAEAGETGHGVMIARARMIPVSVGQAGATSIAAGTPVTLHPERGLIVDASA